MLKKLIKQEWKSVWKILAMINIFLLVITVIGILFLSSPLLRTRSSLIEILLVTATMFYYLAIFACSIANMAYIAVRYYKTMYSDEAYLTHTLPVTKRQLILSKLFVGFIWSVINSAVVFGSVVSLLTAAFYSLSDETGIWTRLLYNFKKELLTETGLSMTAFLLYCAFYMVLSLLYSLLTIYSAIALGQLFTKHKIIGSILFYFLELTVIQIFSLAALSAPFTLLTLSINGQNSSTSSISPIIVSILAITAVITIILCVLQYIIAEYMARKKLNLD